MPGIPPPQPDLEDRVADDPAVNEIGSLGKTCTQAVKEAPGMVTEKPVLHRGQRRKPPERNLTPKQKSFYWNTWNNVRKIIVEKGWACSVNVEDIRHDLTEKALGYAKSSKDLTNEEFDKVLEQFWSVSLPVDLNERLHELDQPTTRFLYQAYHLIDRTGEVEESSKVSYLEALCNRIAGCANPERINKGERRAVIATLTLHALRARNRRKAVLTRPSPFLP